MERGGNVLAAVNNVPVSHSLLPAGKTMIAAYDLMDGICLCEAHSN